MALKAVLDNLDGIDPSLHEHYTEKDGKFYLDIEDDIRKHPKGAGLQAAIDRLKNEKKGLTDKLAEVEAKIAELPEDFDAEQFAADMDELASLRKKVKKDPNDPDDDEAKQQVKRLYEQRITNLEAKHNTEKGKLEKERDDLVREIERLMGDEGLTKALVAAGVDKKLLPGATALLRRSVKVRREDDGSWHALIETMDAGEQTIDEFVATWAQSDEGNIYIEKAKGGGAEGNNGKALGRNPFSKDTRNLTEQQELIRTNPDRARTLAKAAGVAVNW